MNGVSAAYGDDLGYAVCSLLLSILIVKRFKAKKVHFGPHFDRFGE